MQFEPSPTGRSIGLEWELQLLDGQSYDLADGIVGLLDALPNQKNIKPEFIQNTVEILSDPFSDFAAVESQMGGVLNSVQGACDRLGIRLCGSGTHPFGRQLAVLTPMPHYIEMEEKIGLAAHTQITFANHYHIGMESGEQAIAVTNHLIAYLPMLIAVSANSPFWRGYNTGYHSYRQRILAGARSYGIPPAFDDWKAFGDFFQHTLEAGIYESINDIHWDIRPRPHLGTVEIRVADSQPTLRESVDLGAFVYSLVDYIISQIRENGGESLLAAPHPWIQRENAFQASRLGIGATYVNEGMRGNCPLEEQIGETFESLVPSASRLGLSEYVRRVRERTFEGRTGAGRQLECYRSMVSMERVAESLSAELEFVPLRSRAIDAPHPTGHG